MNANLSIVIVNYNSGELLSTAISICISQAAEVIVVDNASSDGSIALCSVYVNQYSSLKIIYNDVNLGFAAACNIGYRAATNSAILFLNPDCRLTQNSVDDLTSTLYSENGCGMVGGLLVNPDGSEQGGGRRAIPTLWRSFVRAFGLHRLANRWPRLFYDFYLHKQPLPDTAIEVEAISGACMMVKREAVEEVGLWDEDYFLHCEDLDWCMRFRDKGWKILFVPTAKVVHQQGACSQSRPFFVEWHKHKGMIHFYRKFFRNQYPLGLMGLVITGVWIRFSLVCIQRSVKLLGDILSRRYE
ncbi:glycosyltransferase family 2 protein [Spartinivicinus ruber]|uniref:glycosyltransferase family 2 protein n=1 Tax=Spartinivicinus ruber TaxID=2683272 RepID=UPI0013D42F64|nr:glycosyltransferase family 2 protein [Spartinivicinus ruber]